MPSSARSRMAAAGAAGVNLTDYRGLYITISHGGSAFTRCSELKFRERDVGYISGATGTAIGNMTSGGGLAAAFNGAANTGATSAGRNANTGSTLGKDWGAGVSKNIDAIAYWEPTDGKIDGGADTEDVDVSLYGTTDGNPTGGTLIKTWENIFSGDPGSVYGHGKLLSLDTGAISDAGSI